MDDAAVVRRFEAVGKLASDARHFVERHRTLGKPVGERDTVDELQNKRRDVAAFFDAVDGADVRVV